MCKRERNGTLCRTEYSICLLFVTIPCSFRRRWTPIRCWATIRWRRSTSTAIRRICAKWPTTPSSGCTGSAGPVNQRLCCWSTAPPTRNWSCGASFSPSCWVWSAFRWPLSSCAPPSSPKTRRWNSTTKKIKMIKVDWCVYVDDH